MIFDSHYHNPKLVNLYDLSRSWGADHDFYLALAKSESQRILDLGCGTGLLCDAYASRGHEVTGIDPSAAMLGIARTKPHGEKIKWVLSSAQNFKPEKKFDLIIMSGHTFHLLYDGADVRATMTMVKKYLSPKGSFAFDSRSPGINWSKRWNYHVDLETPEANVSERRRFLRMKNDRVTLEYQFQFPDEKIFTASSLRFWSRREIEHYVTEADLKVEKLLGGWEGQEFESSKSE